MKYYRLIGIGGICLFALTACQRQAAPLEQNADIPQPDQAPQLVQAADGTNYDVSCIQANAQEIAQTGKSAMAQCAVSGPSGVSGSTQSRIFVSRDSNGHRYWWAWIYYWPYYYNTTSSYNYLGYYLLGNYWNNSYYNTLFGYNSSYNNYYNSSCTFCYYYSPSCYYSCYTPITYY